LPDGAKVVFLLNHQNEPQATPPICVIDANGENLVELIDEPEHADYGT